MPVPEAKAAWLTAFRGSRSQRLPAGPPQIAATKPKRSIKRSDSRAAPGGRVSNTAGGNAAANAPNEGLGRLPDRTVPALQAQVGDRSVLIAGGRDHRRSANALTHGRRL
jgi:hypothetical protein